MKKEHIVFYIIFATFLVSFVSLGISCYRAGDNLGLDYLGIIVGILALLVTVLIGLQLYNYIYARENIQSIIDEKVKRIVSDSEHISIARDKLSAGFVMVVSSYDCPRIADAIMNSLEEALKCDDEEMRNHAIDYIMGEAHLLCTEYSIKGKLIKKGKRPDYLHILKNIDHRYGPELTEYMKLAAEVKNDNDDE